MIITPIIKSLIGQSPSQPPDTPTNLMVTTISDSSIQAGWTESENATFYEYKIVAQTAADFPGVSWVRLTETFVQVDELDANTQYWVIVRAGNDAGVSEPTSPFSATTFVETEGLASNNFNDYAYLGSIVFSQSEPPTCQIIVPNVSGSPTQRVWSIGFIWDLEVVGFSDDDVIVSGEDAPLSNFAGEGFDYTANITFPPNTKGQVTITIKTDSVSTPDGIVGPPSDIEAVIDFDTRTKTQPQNILCQRQLTNSLNNDLALLNPGGVFRNIKSACKLDNFIYFVCQIQRHGGLFGRVSPTAQTSLTYLDDGATFYIQAGAVLYRVNTDDCSFEIIKRYKSITTAARSLTAHNGRVYGIEGSHYSHLNDGLLYNVEANQNEYIRSRFRDVDENWKKLCGNLFSIDNSESQITEHGIVTSAIVEDNPYFNRDNPDKFYGIHTGTASPITSDSDGVSAVLGYGDYQGVKDITGESEVSRYKNLSWVNLNTKLNRNLPVLTTNSRSAFDIMSLVAKLTNSIIYFEDDTFFFKPRINANEPDYTLELNSLSLEEPIEDISVYNDIGNLWNAIKITYEGNKTFEDEDEESIKKNNKRKEYELELDLEDINIDWINWIAETFLERFKTVRTIVTCQLKPSPHIKLGDKVGIKAKERVFLEGNYQVIGHYKFIQEQRSEVKFVSL